MQINKNLIKKIYANSTIKAYIFLTTNIRRINMLRHFPDLIITFISFEKFTHPYFFILFII